MDQFWNIIIAFCVGAGSSFIVVYLYECATKPDLDITHDPKRSQGQRDGYPPHEFYHVVVINKPPGKFVGVRRPAWATSATIAIENSNGDLIIKDVMARWTSQPEPMIPFLHDGKIINLLDPAKIVFSRKVDAHRHEQHHLPIILKYEGEKECYVFSNESYKHDMWKNPDWKISEGCFRIKIKLNYDGGPKTYFIDLQNNGITRDDIKMIIRNNTRIVTT
jgi:hypothetical protein